MTVVTALKEGANYGQCIYGTVSRSIRYQDVQSERPNLLSIRIERCSDVQNDENQYCRVVSEENAGANQIS